MKILKSELGENYVNSMDFALNALKYEAFLHMKNFSSKNMKKQRAFSAVDHPRKTSPRKAQRISLPLISKNHVTNEDLAAARIQASFKSYYTLKLRKAHLQGMFY